MTSIPATVADRSSVSGSRSRSGSRRPSLSDEKDILVNQVFNTKEKWRIRRGREIEFIAPLQRLALPVLTPPSIISLCVKIMLPLHLFVFVSYVH